MKKLMYSFVIFIFFILCTFVMDFILKNVKNDFTEMGGVGGKPVATISATSSELQDLQEIYKQQYGKYFQIKPDGTLEDGTLPQNILGKAINAGVQINEFQKEGEAGWQVLWSDDKGSYSKGFGIDADFNTWTKLYPTVIATST